MGHDLDALRAEALRLNRAAGAFALPPVLILSDRFRIDPARQMAAMAPGGLFIYRDYDDPNRAAIAHDLRQLAAAHGLWFSLAGDPRLALRLKADGCHLPAWMVTRLKARLAASLGGGRLFLTAAAHNPAEIRRAVMAGADAVLISPVFATGSHPGARPLGPARFATLAALSPIPVYALGGITAKSARRLSLSPPAGLAVVSLSPRHRRA